MKHAGTKKARQELRAGSPSAVLRVSVSERSHTPDPCRCGCGAVEFPQHGSARILGDLPRFDHAIVAHIDAGGKRGVDAAAAFARAVPMARRESRDQTANLGTGGRPPEEPRLAPDPMPP